jgi:hypothetical protein
MHESRLVSGLSATFGAMALTFVALGLVYSLVFLPVGAMFGLVAYLLWYHASGRLASRIYRSVERQAAPPDDGQAAGTRDRNAGPREAWEPPRDGRTARGAAGRARGRRRRRRRATRPGASDDRPSREEAYRTLDLDPGADEATVKEAYRRKVKSVHPDADSGDEETFKRVTAAYERLTDGD